MSAYILVDAARMPSAFPLVLPFFLHALYGVSAGRPILYTAQIDFPNLSMSRSRKSAAHLHDVHNVLDINTRGKILVESGDCAPAVVDGLLVVCSQLDLRGYRRCSGRHWMSL
jgi:hypothetical protein